MARSLNIAWSAALITALLWALTTPGMLGLRDMVVIHSPALSLNNLGFGNNGTLPARNVPQDALLALTGQVLPADWVARALLLSAAIAGAWAASRFGLAGITLTLYNPFVIERLLQGHWTLAIAAWLIPVIMHPRLSAALLGVWLASLTPGGLLLGGILLLVAHPRLISCVWVGVCSLPWLVPSLLALGTGTTVQPTSAFYSSPTWQWLFGGGIWNAEVHSTSVLASVCSIVVFLCCMPFAARRYQVLGVGVLSVLLLIWLAPTGWQLLPGAGLLRDSHKLLYLLLPALISGAGKLRTSRALAALVIIAALAHNPLAPTQLNQLRGIPEQPWPRSSGDLLITDSTGLVNYYGRPMVDPRLKANQSIEAAELRVDGTVIDAPTDAYRQALAARSDQTQLIQLGVGLVIDGDTQTEIGGRSEKGWRYLLGLGLTCWWLLLPAAIWLSRRKKAAPVASQE